ncbi:MAG TPA: UbiA family prenyltransferase [Bryobacteraceae bacterium]|nr:UbiA family prenyltransferase [Bryobacteraceae bacterium]
MSATVASLRALRVHQWVKNLLVLAPVVSSHQLARTEVLEKAGIMLLAFCLCASGAYLVNDLADVDSDRQHPVKKSRPFASAALPPAFGYVMGPLLMLGGIALGLLLPREALSVLIAYCAITLIYSLWLKTKALMDVFVLAALYTLRVVGGGVACGIELSSWLLSFSMFTFLSLGFCKRAAELHNLAGRGEDAAQGRGYRSTDLPQINAFGVASGFLATLVLTLYMNSDQIRVLYARPWLVWLLFPLMLYWITRMWILCWRGEMNEDPVWFAVRDPATWLIVAASGVVLYAAALK